MKKLDKDLVMVNLSELKKIKAYKTISREDKDIVFLKIAEGLAREDKKVLVYKTNDGQRYDCRLKVYIVDKNIKRTRKSADLEDFDNLLETYDYRLYSYKNNLMQWLLTFIEEDNFYEILEEAVEETGWLSGDKNSEWLTIHIDNPAGEDYFIEVVNEDIDSIIETIECQYNNFDIDEYVEMWLDAKRNGVGGVPGAKTLVKNAEYLEEALFKLLMNVQRYFS